MKKMFALLLAASMLGGAALAETTVDATTGASQVTTPDAQLPQSAGGPEAEAVQLPISKRLPPVRGGDPSGKHARGSLQQGGGRRHGASPGEVSRYTGRASSQCPWQLKSWIVSASRASLSTMARMRGSSCLPAGVNSILFPSRLQI